MHKKTVGLKIITPTLFLDVLTKSCSSSDHLLPKHDLDLSVKAAGPQASRVHLLHSYLTCCEETKAPREAPRLSVAEGGLGHTRPAIFFWHQGISAEAE